MMPLDDDDDSNIGRPIQAPIAAASRKPTEAHLDVGYAAGMAGAHMFLASEEPRPDEGPGRPIQATIEMRAITDSDREQIRLTQDREEAEEKRRIDELLASEATLLRLPAFLAHPLVVAFLVGMAALVGLFVISHVASTLAALESFAPGFRYAAYAILALLGICTFLSIARFAWFYFRLRSNRPISHQGLSQLSQRTRLRWLVQAKKNEAREQLADYLQSFPFRSESERKALIGFGLTEEKLVILENVRTNLLDRNRFGNNDAWFVMFHTQFQSILDEAANARIAHYSLRVAATTAISPNSLVDVLLTTYCSFMMMTDLCRIYQLRMGTMSTLAFLGQIFFNSYVAGQLNELEGMTEAGIEATWQEVATRIGADSVLSNLGKIGIKTGARGVSGILNYFLLRRLGRSAAWALRPIHPNR